MENKSKVEIPKIISSSVLNSKFLKSRNFIVGDLWPLEKVFTSLRTYAQTKDSRKRKNRFCITCGNIATTEALFDVGGGVSVIEKYCDMCAKQVK